MVVTAFAKIRVIARPSSWFLGVVRAKAKAARKNKCSVVPGRGVCGGSGDPQSCGRSALRLLPGGSLLETKWTRRGWDW